jgi:hypothetical protein
MKTGIFDPSKKEFFINYYKESLKGSSYKTVKPVFDVSELFEEELFQFDNRNKVVAWADYSDIISSILKEKWDNIPAICIQDIYRVYVTKELHVFPYTHKLSSPQQQILEDYIRHKLDTSNGFPFPKAIDESWKIAYETRFGIRTFAHDMYQPILMQHKTQPVTFKDRTVDILVQCPTTIYDQPEKICAEFPVSYLMSNPFFTYPREVPKFYGDHPYKMSLFDLYSTPMGQNIAARSLPLVKANIPLMFKNSNTAELVAKLSNRCTIASGGFVRTQDDFKNKEAWLLAREVLSEKVNGGYSKGLVLTYNRVKAMEEVNRRQKEDLLKIVAEDQEKLAKELARIRQEEGY